MRCAAMFSAMLAGLFCLGCPMVPEPPDLEGPVLVGVEPSAGAMLLPGEVVRLTFSEAVDPEFIHQDSVVLVSADADETLISDLANPPLSSSRIDRLILAVVTMDGPDTVVVEGVGEWSWAEGVSLVVTPVVRDMVGNPLKGDEGADSPAVRRFATPAEPDVEPPMARLALPQEGEQLVPPGLEVILVEFSEEVVGGEAVRLVDRLGAEVPCQVDVNPDHCARYNLGFCAILSLRGPLAPDQEHRVEAGGGIEDRSRNPLVPASLGFRTSPWYDREAPEITDLTMEGGDNYAIIRWFTAEPADASVLYGFASPEEGRVDRPGARLEQEIRLTGLIPDSTYMLEARSWDLSGNMAVASATLITSPPLPHVVVTEVMANPEGLAEEEPAREFVEVYNNGDDDQDLAGWSIDGGERVMLPAGVPALLPARSVGLIVGRDFEVPWGLDVAVFRTDTPGLNKSSGLTQTCQVLLFDPAGVMVSSYGGHIKATKDGVSVVRVSPDEPDLPESWMLCPEGSTAGRI